MNNHSTLGCFHIAGTYHAESVIIGYNNGQLRGQWLTVNRPNFTGNVSADCKGKVKFPDDRTYKFEFDKFLNKITWKENVYRDPWRKGNLLSF